MPKRHISRNLASKALLAVHLIIVCAPLSILIVWAFSAAWPSPHLLPTEFSLAGIEEVFNANQNLGKTLLLSIGIALACALITTIISSCAAHALARYRFRGAKVFRFATAIPFLIPTTVFAMGVQVAFIRAGLAYTISGVILAHCIVALPFAVAIMIDVYRAAGNKLDEAARTLGANSWQTIFQVSIPTLLPGLFSAFTMSYILSFSQYFLTLLIGGGAVQTFVLDMFPYLASGNRTIASAYGLVFIGVTFGVFLVLELLLKRLYGKSEQTYYSL